MALQRTFEPTKNAVLIKGNANALASKLDANDIPMGGSSIGLLSVNFDLNNNITTEDIPDTSGEFRTVWASPVDSINPTVTGDVKAIPKALWPIMFKGSSTNVPQGTAVEKVVRVYPCGDGDEVYNLPDGLNASNATFELSGDGSPVTFTDVELNITHPSFTVTKGGDLDLAATAAEDGYVDVLVTYDHEKSVLVKPFINIGDTFQVVFHGINVSDNSKPWKLVLYKVEFAAITKLALTSDKTSVIPITMSARQNNYRVSLGLPAYYEYINSDVTLVA